MWMSEMHEGKERRENGKESEKERECMGEWERKGKESKARQVPGASEVKQPSMLDRVRQCR